MSWIQNIAIFLYHCNVLTIFVSVGIISRASVAGLYRPCNIESWVAGNLKVLKRFEDGAGVPTLDIWCRVQIPTTWKVFSWSAIIDVLPVEYSLPITGQWKVYLQPMAILCVPSREIPTGDWCRYHVHSTNGRVPLNFHFVSIANHTDRDVLDVWLMHNGPWGKGPFFPDIKSRLSKSIWSYRGMPDLICFKAWCIAEKCATGFTCISIDHIIPAITDAADLKIRSSPKQYPFSCA